MTKFDWEEFYNDASVRDLQEKCQFEVNCICCGKLIMYADPTHHEGMRLPDMICLRCKKGLKK